MGKEFEPQSGPMLDICMYGTLEHNGTDIEDESEIWLIKRKYATLVKITIDPYCAKNCSKNMILIWWTMIVI